MEKIGIIGYRNHAKKLLDLVEEKHEFKVTHIYHPTKNIDDSRSTNNLKNLYKCDGIIIASPNTTHFDYIKQIIENSNCLIFCEKPPVTSLKAIQFLENLSIKNKKRIFFNFNLRLSKINDILQKYSNSEKLGKLIQINIITSMGFAFKTQYLNSWRADGKNNLHNIIENNSIHWIDLMVFNFGKISNANYLPRLISNNGTSYDTNSVNLQFENGITTSIFTSYATPLIENIIIIGTNGLIILKDDKMEIFYPRDTFDENGLFTKPKNHLETDFNFNNNVKQSLKNSINHFLDHVKNNQGFKISDFNSSVISNKLVLELENSNF